MEEHKTAQELAQLLFILKREMLPEKGKKSGMRHRDIMFLSGICEIADGDMVKMSAISDFFHITPAAVSQIIRGYEQEGWIDRILLDRDRRSVYIRVSDKAKRIMEECQNEMWSRLLDYIHFLGEEDSRHLLNIMRRTSGYFKDRCKEEES
ncbi:MAG: MarR family transcriptional regulator [Erysipelotrichaceae bacterium]|jgi:DNA-binding MarR family transcriptional regulator|nr:MarR family transcriptional regulator [Erysipelotrichaceae bacterium]